MLEKEILAHTLKNSLEHGKADPSKILPKLFQHGLGKKDIKKVMPLILETVKKINSLSEKEKQALIPKYKKYIPIKEDRPHDLPDLPNKKKKMVFRLAPFPSGALHIGNAKTFFLNSLYAEKYKGKLLLIMDDTIGSEAKPIMPESYSLIKQAFSWLKINYKKPIIYKSDRLEIYYKYALQLIKKDKAYVCHCSQEKLRKNRELGMECGCRQLPPKIQLLRWQEMFKMDQGHATLRIKTSMSHPNPAFRDRVLFKISDRPHPRTKKKYRIWPTLEMSWAIDDHLLGVTHIIRGSDLLIETDMENYIWNIFHWKKPTTIHTGLVNLENIGAKLSKSKAQDEVKSGKFLGWSDPRTWSIQSLEKRGIKPEAIREFVKDIGLNKQNISAPIESLYSINRKLIDQSSDRYSFISKPVEIKVTNKPKIKTVKVPIHPDRKETRTMKVSKIFISSDDFNKFKGKEIRLLHLYNIELDKKISSDKRAGFPTADATFTSSENKNIPKINWVSSNVPCSILMPSGEIIKGIGEAAIKTLKNSKIVQLERFGFARFEKREKNNNEFWFAHK